MTIYWIYLTAFILSTTLVLAATPVVRHLALTFNHLDAPAARKVHRQPMVRLGGVAIFGATLFSIYALWATGALSLLPADSLKTALILLLGGSGFFLVGLADDLFNLSAINRLWMQGAIATVLWGYGIRVEAIALPGMDAAGISSMELGWLSLPITVLWLAGVVNAINWIDGLDGLATGISGIAVAVLFLLSVATDQWHLALLSIALLGSLVGFLYFNYSPASIFMGDGGSYFIGFMLASLCLVGPQRFDSSVATLLPLAILAVPVGDMLCVILARLYRKQSPFSADNRHFHHRLLQMGIAHKSVVWVMYALTVTTSTLAFVMLGLVSTWVLAAELLALLLCLVGYVIRVLSLFDETDVVGGKVEWFSGNQ